MQEYLSFILRTSFICYFTLAVNCTSPPVIANASITSTSMTVNGTTTYRCIHGYRAAGTLSPTRALAVTCVLGEDAMSADWTVSAGCEGEM